MERVGRLVGGWEAVSFTWEWKVMVGIGEWERGHDWRVGGRGLEGRD